MLALTVAAVVGGILALPISDTTRAQLLSLLGILLSAAIALSSTTFLGNIMAGMMLRAVRPFKGGDFIRIGEHFGRVSERELFHIEIQTADRDLTTLPNLYVVTNPFTVVRKSGTIVSTRLSLGYDVPRTRVEDLLLEAASRAGLDKPFVQIVELGDFSVTYRIAGLCTEVDQMLSTRSRLRASVMDVLHEGDVEIVSPEFRNLRNLESDRAIIPEAAARSRARESDGDGPEGYCLRQSSSGRGARGDPKAIRRDGESDRDAEGRAQDRAGTEQGQTRASSRATRSGTCSTHRVPRDRGRTGRRRLNAIWAPGF